MSKLSPKSVITTLSKYSPCDVSDSLVKHGIANGGYIPNLSIRSPQILKNSVVGKAYTVLYAPKSDPRPAVKQSYVDEIPEDAMVVIGLPLNQQLTSAPYVTVNNALYGGLMSTRAQYRKANGSVILGRIRDLDEHLNLNFPVWSYGVGSTQNGPVVKVVGINVPLQIKVNSINADDPPEILTIQPEEYIVADKNGAVRIPNQQDLDFDSVLDYIPKRIDADEHVREDITNGKNCSESQKYWRSKI